MKFDKQEKWLQNFAIACAFVGFLTIVSSIVLFGYKEHLSTTHQINSDKFADFGSFISGTAGVLWSLASVILFYITLRLQRKELSLQRRVNQTILEDNRANAILDLYQAYITPEFRLKRQKAWNVLRMCIGSKEYTDYVVGHFFPVVIKPNGTRRIQGDLAEYYKKAMVIRFPFTKLDSIEKIVDCDREDRHALDDFLNFFSLLVLRKTDTEKDTFKACEFYYDHWRPLLWFISYERDKYYNQNDIVRKYSRQVDLTKMLREIDGFYGYEQLRTIEDILSYVSGHPIINEMAKDPKHDFMVA